MDTHSNVLVNNINSGHDDARYNKTSDTFAAPAFASQFCNNLPTTKRDGQTTRPCAVIGPDRIIPQVRTDNFGNAPSNAPWAQTHGESSYYRFPVMSQYPEHFYPPRNISPRHTFQENMARIVVPSRHDLSARPEPLQGIPNNYQSDENICFSKPVKSNVVGPKYSEVPYVVSRPTNEHRQRYGQKNAEVFLSKFNNGGSAVPPIVNTNIPLQPWQQVSVPHYHNPYSTPATNHRPEKDLIHCPPHLYRHANYYRKSENTPDYAEPTYYRSSELRYEPYPAKEKYSQPKYDYGCHIPNQGTNPNYAVTPKYNNFTSNMSNAPTQFPYPAIPHKYIDNRVPNPTEDCYHKVSVGRTLTSYNVPYRHSDSFKFSVDDPAATNQGKVYSYEVLEMNNRHHIPKNLESDKVQYDFQNPVRNVNFSDNRFQSDLNYTNIQKHAPYYNPPPVNACFPSRLTNHNITYINKAMDNQHFLRSYESDINSTYKSYEGRQNTYNPLARIPTEFSPNIISPTDSNTSVESSHSLPQYLNQEDCGYVSQCSTVSNKSVEYSSNTNKNYDHKISDDRRIVNSSAYMLPPKESINCKQQLEAHKDKELSKPVKQIDVRQFLQMWDEEFEENIPALPKHSMDHVTIKIPEIQVLQSQEKNNSSQLYVLDSMNISSEELKMYEHVQKVTKLPDHIKGYDNIELLKQFDEIVQSNQEMPYSKQQPHSSMKYGIGTVSSVSRPISPLDVEAKISQSVIHKEVGCNFEIRPCSPTKIDIEIKVLPTSRAELSLNFENSSYPPPMGVTSTNVMSDNSNKICDQVDDHLNKNFGRKREKRKLKLRNDELITCKLPKFSNDCSRSSCAQLDNISQNKPIDYKKPVQLASLPQLDCDDYDMSISSNVNSPASNVLCQAEKTKIPIHLERLEMRKTVVLNSKQENVSLGNYVNACPEKESSKESIKFIYDDFDNVTLESKKTVLEAEHSLNKQFKSPNVNEQHRPKLSKFRKPKNVSAVAAQSFLNFHAQVPEIVKEDDNIPERVLSTGAEKENSFASSPNESQNVLAVLNPNSLESDMNEKTEMLIKLNNDPSKLAINEVHDLSQYTSLEIKSKKEIVLNNKVDNHSFSKTEQKETCYFDKTSNNENMYDRYLSSAEHSSSNSSHTALKINLTSNISHLQERFNPIDINQNIDTPVDNILNNTSDVDFNTPSDSDIAKNINLLKNSTHIQSVIDVPSKQNNSSSITPNSFQDKGISHNSCSNGHINNYELTVSESSSDCQIKNNSLISPLSTIKQNINLTVLCLKVLSKYFNFDQLKQSNKVAESSQHMQKTKYEPTDKPSFSNDNAINNKICQKISVEHKEADCKMISSETKKCIQELGFSSTNPSSKATAPEQSNVHCYNVNRNIKPFKNNLNGRKGDIGLNCDGKDGPECQNMELNDNDVDDTFSGVSEILDLSYSKNHCNKSLIFPKHSSPVSKHINYSFVRKSDRDENGERIHSEQDACAVIAKDGQESIKKISSAIQNLKHADEGLGLIPTIVNKDNYAIEVKLETSSRNEIETHGNNISYDSEMSTFSGIGKADQKQRKNEVVGEHIIPNTLPSKHSVDITSSKQTDSYEIDSDHNCSVVIKNAEKESKKHSTSPSFRIDEEKSSNGKDLCNADTISTINNTPPNHHTSYDILYRDGIKYCGESAKALESYDNAESKEDLHNNDHAPKDFDKEPGTCDEPFAQHSKDIVLFNYCKTKPMPNVQAINTESRVKGKENSLSCEVTEAHHSGSSSMQNDAQIKSPSNENLESKFTLDIKGSSNNGENVNVNDFNKLVKNTSVDIAKDVTDIHTSSSLHILFTASEVSGKIHDKLFYKSVWLEEGDKKRSTNIDQNIPTPKGNDDCVVNSTGHACGGYSETMIGFSTKKNKSVDEAANISCAYPKLERLARYNFDADKNCENKMKVKLPEKNDYNLESNGLENLRSTVITSSANLEMQSSVELLYSPSNSDNISVANDIHIDSVLSKYINVNDNITKKNAKKGKHLKEHGVMNTESDGLKEKCPSKENTTKLEEAIVSTSSEFIDIENRKSLSLASSQDSTIKLKDCPSYDEKYSAHTVGSPEIQKVTGSTIQSSYYKPSISEKILVDKRMDAESSDILDHQITNSEKQITESDYKTEMEIEKLPKYGPIESISENAVYKVNNLSFDNNNHASTMQEKSMAPKSNSPVICTGTVTEINEQTEVLQQKKSNFQYSDIIEDNELIMSVKTSENVLCNDVNSHLEVKSSEVNKPNIGHEKIKEGVSCSQNNVSCMEVDKTVENNNCFILSNNGSETNTDNDINENISNNRGSAVLLNQNNSSLILEKLNLDSTTDKSNGILLYKPESSSPNKEWDVCSYNNMENETCESSVVTGPEISITHKYTTKASCDDHIKTDVVIRKDRDSNMLVNQKDYNLIDKCQENEKEGPLEMFNSQKIIPTEKTLILKLNEIEEKTLNKCAPVDDTSAELIVNTYDLKICESIEQQSDTVSNLKQNCEVLLSPGKEMHSINEDQIQFVLTDKYQNQINGGTPNHHTLLSDNFVDSVSTVAEIESNVYQEIKNQSEHINKDECNNIKCKTIEGSEVIENKIILVRDEEHIGILHGDAMIIVENQSEFIEHEDIFMSNNLLECSSDDRYEMNSDKKGINTDDENKSEPQPILLCSYIPHSQFDDSNSLEQSKDPYFHVGTMSPSPLEVSEDYSYGNVSVDDSNCQSAKFEDCWIDDVACVETVISEEMGQNENSEYESDCVGDEKEFEVCINNNIGMKKNISSVVFPVVNYNAEFDISADNSVNESNSGDKSDVCKNFRLNSLNAIGTKFSFLSSLENPNTIQSNIQENKNSTINNKTNFCLYLPDLKASANAQNLKKKCNTMGTFHNEFDNYDKKENVQKNPTVTKKTLNIINPINNKLSDTVKKSPLEKFTFQTERSNFKINKKDTKKTFSVKKYQRRVREKENDKMQTKENNSINSQSKLQIQFVNVESMRDGKLNDTVQNYEDNSIGIFEKKQLITKAAQKYIPPISPRQFSFKVRLPLPKNRLLCLKKKQSNCSTSSHNVLVNINSFKGIEKNEKKYSSNMKPKFDEVLQNIDDLHKRTKTKSKSRKDKAVKEIIPKVIIKKNEHGAHYASTSAAKESFNPDLTGSKWQPWVRLEKNNFIEKMIRKNKTRTLYYLALDRYKIVPMKNVANSASLKLSYFAKESNLSVSKSLKCTIRLKSNSNESKGKHSHSHTSHTYHHIQSPKITSSRNRC